MDNMTNSWENTGKFLVKVFNFYIIIIMIIIIILLLLLVNDPNDM